MRAAAQPHTIEIAPLTCRADVASLDRENRTVELVFSTGAAVERYDRMAGKRYIEKLSLDPSSVRLARLNAGGPLLDAHSAYSITDQIGAVVPGTVRIGKGEARATVKFSQREAVAGIWQDVQDGIVRSVSVGYRVYKFVEDQPKGNALAVRTAVDWEPYEVSMVPMPADAGARVRTDESKASLNRCEVVLHDLRADADRLRSFRLLKARTPVSALRSR